MADSGEVSPASRSPEAIAPGSLPTIAGETIDALSGGTLMPPFVSIVVVAYNHERFVGETIESIRRQDYPWFECIVVDNGSTDGTAAAIRAHVGNDPRFTTIFRRDNAGQVGAFLEVFDRLRGEFVMAVDSDDTLLSNAVSTHLQVHLALPSLVGLTSGQIIQTDEAGQILLSGGRRPPRMLRDGRLIDPARAMRLPTVSDETYRLLDRSVIEIEPQRAGWLWSPSSANMFRRSAMALSRPHHPATALYMHLDGHFLPLCHALMGSALIRLPLSTYRLHGTNINAAAIMASTLHAVKPGQREQQEFRVAERCATVLYDPAAFVALVSARRFWPLIEQLCLAGGARVGSAPLRAPFAEKYAALVEIFGLAGTLAGLSRMFPPAAVRRIVASGAGRQPRVNELALIAIMEFAWQSRRIARGIRRRLARVAADATDT